VDLCNVRPKLQTQTELRHNIIPSKNNPKHIKMADNRRRNSLSDMPHSHRPFSSSTQVSNSVQALRLRLADIEARDSARLLNAVPHPISVEARMAEAMARVRASRDFYLSQQNIFDQSDESISRVARLRIAIEDVHSISQNNNTSGADNDLSVPQFSISGITL